MASDSPAATGVGAKATLIVSGMVLNGRHGEGHGCESRQGGQRGWSRYPGAAERVEVGVDREVQLGAGRMIGLAEGIDEGDVLGHVRPVEALRRGQSSPGLGVLLEVVPPRRLRRRVRIDRHYSISEIRSKAVSTRGRRSLASGQLTDQGGWNVFHELFHPPV